MTAVPGTARVDLPSLFFFECLFPRGVCEGHGLKLPSNGSSPVFKSITRRFPLLPTLTGLCGIVAALQEAFPSPPCWRLLSPFFSMTREATVMLNDDLFSPATGPLFLGSGYFMFVLSPAASYRGLVSYSPFPLRPRRGRRLAFTALVWSIFLALGRLNRSLQKLCTQPNPKLKHQPPHHTKPTQHHTTPQPLIDGFFPPTKREAYIPPGTS